MPSSWFLATLLTCGTLVSGDGQEALAEAEALLRAGRQARSIQVLEEWCNAAPEDHGRWSTAAGFLMSRGGHVEAQRFTARAAELRPGDLVSQQIHATALLLGHRSREAQRLLEPLVRRHPKNADLHFQLGMARATNQEFQRAAESFDRALELSPDSGVFHFWAGDNCERLNRFEDAERHLRRALRRPDQSPDAGWKLASVLVHRGDLEEAEREFLVAVNGAPGRARQRAAFHYGVFLFEQERDDEAEPVLRGVTRDWPEHRMAWYYLARVQRRVGKTDPARESVRRYQALQKRENELEEATLLSLIQDRLRPGAGR